MNQVGQAFAVFGVVCALAAGVGVAFRLQGNARDKAGQEREQESSEDRAAIAKLEKVARPSPPAATLTMRQALAVAKPATEQADEVDAGALDFIRWAMKSMRWDDIATSKNETTFAKVMKDPDVEAGRVLCARGELAEILAVKVDGKKVYGLTMVVTNEINQGAVIRIYAVGDTGELVGGSEAVFCGVVLGAFSYKSLAGARVRAMNMVGMFRPPANTATARPKASAAPSAKP